MNCTDGHAPCDQRFDQRVDTSGRDSKLGCGDHTAISRGLEWNSLSGPISGVSTEPVMLTTVPGNGTLTDLHCAHHFTGSLPAER